MKFDVFILFSKAQKRMDWVLVTIDLYKSFIYIIEIWHTCFDYFICSTWGRRITQMTTWETSGEVPSCEHTKCGKMQWKQQSRDMVDHVTQAHANEWKNAETCVHTFCTCSNANAHPLIHTHRYCNMFPFHTQRTVGELPGSIIIIIIITIIIIIIIIIIWWWWWWWWLIMIPATQHVKKY